MPLSVTCPRCASKYQLDAAMRGKKMRCPNTICRAVFEVRDDSDVPAGPPPVAEPAPPPVAEKPKEAPPPPVVSKPIEAPPPVISKPVEPKPPPPAPPTPAKLDEVKETPPPVVTKPVAPKKTEPPKPKPIPKPIEPAADFPDDFPGDDETAPAPDGPVVATEAWQPDADAWDAPPVREEAAPAVASEPVQLAAPTPAPVKRRRALFVIAAMFLLLLVGAGVAYWQIRGGIASNEAERFDKAEALYKDDKFADASAALQKMHADFPDSPHNKKYRFLAELSDVRQAVYGRDDTKQALPRMRQFLVGYQGDPLLKERENDVWLTLNFLANELTSHAERDKAPDLLSQSRHAWAEAKKYPPPGGIGQAERKLEDEWKRVEQVLALHFEREFVLASLKKHVAVANASSVQDAWALVEKTKRLDDAEVRKLLDELVKAHREQVVFVPANSDARSVIDAGDSLPSLSVTPLVQMDRPVTGSHPLVLSLARGVLYALEPANGAVRWSRRLGIDTNVLPLRVPADAITPELLLALSSDQRSLSALIADTGEVLWQTPLSDACLGQPVLIDRQVLVPTLAGRIEEIELAEGRVLGAYQVGQPLTLGGVRQPGAPFVYFPADDFCLYVFDATKRTCTNILYTRHPAGSLRGLPSIALSDAGPLLLWTQAKGLDRAEIKPYALPIERHDQKPVEPTLQVPSLSAPPWSEADRLALLTEASLMSLWGLKQKGTRDPLLFPLLKRDFPIDAGKGPGRCEIVHADAESYWTLTRGRLQRVQAIFDPKEGPGLLARWSQPIMLGSLLHAAQARRDADGKTILFLTTQADEHPTCLCTAINADDGKTLWQRQLGVLPREVPLVLGSQVVAPDAQGLLRFNMDDKFDKPWQAAGEWLAREGWSDARHFLFGKGTDYVHLTLPRAGTKMRIEMGPGDGASKSRTLDVNLPAHLQGTPALGDGFLLLPLADGILAQVSLKDGSVLKDLDWRVAGAEEQARGHLVLLGQAECVMTDGSRGLVRIVSADAKSWVRRALHELAHRITAAPVILPAEGNAKPRLCVADASDTLTLLDADRLSVLGSWTLPAKITAGPFVRGGRIGCIVARNELVWIDPDKKEFAWQYRFADIVGEPNLIDGVLVVADVAGRFVALDPQSGRPVGAVLTLHANVAATSAPVPFGPGRAFVPLTDGTVVILPLEKLRK
jgi:outer membrane protein assembly factor BamB